MADVANVTAAQVRKDFSIFGITGHRRGGYQVDDLLDQLNKILGKDQIQEIGLDAPRVWGLTGIASPIPLRF